MLILTRKLGESVKINSNQVKLGVIAPDGVVVSREEVFKKVKEENVLSSASGVINHIK